MRIWDINPGYLNRQSLLNEHRELHGLVSHFRQHANISSKHPETRRWQGFGWALKKRHQLLAAEMTLRGYNDRSPVSFRSKPRKWPTTWIDSPGDQLNLLKNKYRDTEQGRIPLPDSTGQLWTQHQYSVMARSQTQYQRLSRYVGRLEGFDGFGDLCFQLTELLRQAPSREHLGNTINHLWDSLRDDGELGQRSSSSASMKTSLNEIQDIALSKQVKSLLETTALCELDCWRIN